MKPEAKHFLQTAAQRESLFGFSPPKSGASNIDRKCEQNTQEAANALIGLGQRNGWLSREGNSKDVAAVQYCLGSVAFSGSWSWANSDYDPEEQKVERAREHGSHGFTGDPAKEVIHPDDKAAAETIALARSAGLAGLRPISPDCGKALAAHQRHAPAASNDDAASVIALARSAGLAGVRQLRGAEHARTTVVD